VAGIPEIVDHKRNGILVPEKDAVRLADALQNLSSTPSLLNQYGEASRQIAEQKFSLTNTIAGLRRVFEKYDLAGRSS